MTLYDLMKIINYRQISFLLLEVDGYLEHAGSLHRSARGLHLFLHPLRCRLLEIMACRPDLIIKRKRSTQCLPAILSRREQRV